MTVRNRSKSPAPTKSVIDESSVALKQAQARVDDACSSL